jgi:hypothetical protein
MSSGLDDKRLAPTADNYTLGKVAPWTGMHLHSNTGTSQGCVPPLQAHLGTPSNPHHSVTGGSVDVYGAPVAVAMYPYYYGHQHGSMPETGSADVTPCEKQPNTPNIPSLQSKAYYDIPHHASMAYPTPYSYAVHHPEHRHVAHHPQHQVFYQYPHGYLQPPPYHAIGNPLEVQPNYTATHDHHRQQFARPELTETYSIPARDIAARSGCAGNGQVVREVPRGHTASTKSTDSAGALEALVHMADAPAVVMHHGSEANGGRSYVAAMAEDDSGDSGHSNDADGGSPELDAAIPVIGHARSKGYGSVRLKSRRGSRAESDASGNSSGVQSDVAGDIPPRKRARH